MSNVNVPKLISQNNAYQHKVTQLEKLLTVKDLEIGAIRNLLGAVLVAAGAPNGSVTITNDQLHGAYELESIEYPATLTWEIRAYVADDVIDVVPSESSAGNADTDNPATTIE